MRTRRTQAVLLREIIIPTATLAAAERPNNAAQAEPATVVATT
jgi:hypothetical protein